MKCPHCNKEITLSCLIGADASFDFLNNPEEDIYTLRDGKPIENEISEREKYIKELSNIQIKSLVDGKLHTQILGMSRAEAIIDAGYRLTNETDNSYASIRINQA